MGYALRDKRHYNYVDYPSWPEDLRYERIDSAALMMAPKASVNHQSLAFEVGRQVGNALEAHPCRVLMAPVDVLLASGDEATEAVDTVV